MGRKILNSMQLPIKMIHIYSSELFPGILQARSQGGRGSPSGVARGRENMCPQSVVPPVPPNDIETLKKCVDVFNFLRV